MSVYVYVEGDTEVLALPTILDVLVGQRSVRKPIPLYGAKVLPRIGKTAAAILSRNPQAHVFACPDLAPNRAFNGTRWAYSHYAGLQGVLNREVNAELAKRCSPRRAEDALSRFHPHPFRHDFEVVLLACPEPLKRRLGTTSDITKHYRSNPEDQDFHEYPKKIVDRLFQRFQKRRYRPTDDCPRILEYASAGDVQGIEERCPRFRQFLAALRRAIAT
ncbi:MAG: DUF4276 family protein [Planctomycetota bacterium]